LIEPSARTGFTLLFISATSLGCLLAWLALHPLQGQNLPPFSQTGGLLGAFINGIVLGMMVGALQWLVLRRMMPDWLWILTSAAGFTVSMIVTQTWQEWFQKSGQAADWLATLPVPMVPAFFVFLAAFCTLWQGLLQWLVLRQYSRPSWVWILIPSIAILLTALLLGLHQFFLEQGLKLPLQSSVLAVGVLGLTQAITLCSLHKRTAFPIQLENPLLANAPLITQQRQIRRLTRRLANQLNRSWEGDVVCERPASYLVGVTEAGAIAAYEPENLTAVDYVEHTPLPQMLNSAQGFMLDGQYSPLARLQVTFLPSGSLQVRGAKGVALFPLAWKLLLAIVVISVLAGNFKISLPFLGR
jgi:hypothetical protein